MLELISNGHRIRVKGLGTEKVSRRAGRAAGQARITAQRPLSLDSSGSFGYDGGLRSDKWKIPDRPPAREVLALPALAVGRAPLRPPPMMESEGVGPT